MITMRWCSAAVAVLGWAISLNPSVSGAAPAGPHAPRGPDAVSGGAVCRYEAHGHVVEGGNRVTPAGPVRDETVEPGRVECVGSVAGRALAESAGTIAWRYRGGTAALPKTLGGDGCVAWGGDGQMAVTLPLADGGQLSLEGPFSAAGVAAIGVLRARFGNISFSGPVAIRPEPGYEDEDCVTKPFNHFIVNGEMVVR